MAWKPQLNFITLHYAYIIMLGVSSLAVLYPYGNLTAIDAYFFGVSGSTESGLNTFVGPLPFLGRKLVDSHG